MMRKGPLLVFLSYFIWGVSPIYWKLLKNMDSVFILENRIVWSAILSLLILFFAGRIKRVFNASLNFLTLFKLFIAGFICVINWGVYIYAVNSNHIVDASLAYFLQPIFAILMASVFFKERLRRLQWLGVLFAFVGVFISIIGYGHIPWMALIIAATFAIYGGIQKTIRMDSIGALLLELIWFVPLVFVVPFISGNVHVPVALDMVEWLLLPTTGIITAVPLFMFAKGITQVDFSLSGILMYINPTLQFLIGVFIYHESLSWLTVFTFVFVWVGLAFYLYDVFSHSQY